MSSLIQELTIVTPTFYPELIGTPHYVTDIARWFSSRNANVRVVTAQPFYPEFERFQGYGRGRRHDSVDDISVLRLPTIVPRQGRAAWRAATDLNFLLQGLSRARRLRCRHVISVSPGTPWTSLVGAAITDQDGRHITLVHDVQSGLASSLGLTASVLSPLARWSERKSLGKADAVATLTPEMAAALQQIGTDAPIEVCPLWATIDPPRHPRDLGHEASVQYSGNFGLKQDLQILLDLAQGLARRRTTFRMLLRGTGDRFTTLRRETEAQQLDHVVFAPPVPTSELAMTLRSSPIHLVLQAPQSGRYVMPSKAINALVSGSYVVALVEPDTPLARMSADTTGLITIPSGNIPEAIRVIDELLSLPDLVDRRLAIATRAAHQFSRDAHMSRLEHLLKTD